MAFCMQKYDIQTTIIYFRGVCLSCKLGHFINFISNFSYEELKSLIVDSRVCFSSICHNSYLAEVARK